MTTKGDEVWKRSIAIDKQERSERMDLLKEHQAKWRAVRAQLVVDCEADHGHVWRYSNMSPHFLTGELPEVCGHCGYYKPWSHAGTLTPDDGED